MSQVYLKMSQNVTRVYASFEPDSRCYNRYKVTLHRIRGKSRRTELLCAAWKKRLTIFTLNEIRNNNSTIHFQQTTFIGSRFISRWRVLDLRQCKIQYTIQKMIVTLHIILCLSLLLACSRAFARRLPNKINSDLHTINVLISIAYVKGSRGRQSRWRINNK